MNVTKLQNIIRVNSQFVKTWWKVQEHYIFHKPHHSSLLGRSQMAPFYYIAVLLYFVFVIASPQTETEWKEWQQEHKKIYSNKDVEDYRKALWMINYKKLRNIM